MRITRIHTTGAAIVAIVFLIAVIIGMTRGTEQAAFNASAQYKAIAKELLQERTHCAVADKLALQLKGLDMYGAAGRDIASMTDPKGAR